MQKNDAACCNILQVVKLKIHLLQHLLVLQSWYNVSTDATWKYCARQDKFVAWQNFPLTQYNLSCDII